MELVVESSGTSRCIYSDELPLRKLGSLSIERASHVEPNSDGAWCADLTPVNGPLLGPFLKRTDALAAEVRWLRDHWLLPVKS